jgi:hypothetical protein
MIQAERRGDAAMDPTTRIPYYAHWQGEEIAYDLPDTQPEPGVGSIIYLTVNMAGELQRRPFVVTGRRLRTDSLRSGGLLSRLGLVDGIPTAVDLDVELRHTEH